MKAAAVAGWLAGMILITAGASLPAAAGASALPVAAAAAWRWQGRRLLALLDAAAGKLQARKGGRGAAGRA